MRLFLPLAALALLCTTARAAEPRPLSELRDRISAAIATNAARVVIPPGVYRGAPEGNGVCHLFWRGIAGLEIVADGVTLVCTKPTRALALDHCRDVTLRGLTIDYDPLPFTQGEVVTTDDAAGWLEVKIHAGYPVAAYTRIDICHRQTRYRKRGKPFMWDSRAELRPDGIVRVSCREAARFAQVGDLASLGGFPPGVIAHTLVLDECDRITLDRVTVHASNCMGIIAAGGEGGHHFVGCRVVPGPPPVGATEARILSTNADAMLCGPMRVGPLVEDCEIRDAGDDSWSIQSADYVVLRREGATLWLAARDQAFARAGDRLRARLSGPTAPIAELTRVAIKDAGLDADIAAKLAAAQPWTFWKLSDGPLLRCTFAAEPPFAVGDAVYDVDRQGNGFVFRRNRVRSSGRVLIKAAGTVEDNVIDTPYGVCANPEVPGTAAAGIASLVIRRNTITDAHTFNEFWSSAQAGAISVTADDDKSAMRPPGVYGQVTIEGNTIRGGNGVGIVVGAADSVTIRGNTLADLQRDKPSGQGGKYGIDNAAAVWLSQCRRVALGGNVLRGPGPYLSHALALGPGVGEVAGGLE